MNDKKIFYIAEYILELSIINIELLSFSPCARACSALLISKKIMKIKGNVNHIKLYYQYNEEENNKIQKKMIILLKKVINLNEKNAIYDKFEKPKYMEVSKFLVNICENKKNKNKQKATEQKTKEKEFERKKKKLI